MSLLSKGPNLDPDALYVCVESFSSADSSCAAGLRLRGSHAAVRARPQFFALADTPDDELDELRRALYPYPRIVN